MAIDLGSAELAIERGDFAAALVALLDAWRAHPDPALADLIDLVGARVPVTPLAGKTLVARDEEFARRAQQDDPRDTPVLLAHALARRQSVSSNVALLRALFPRRHDPRTTAPLIAALASPIWTSPTAQGVWDTIFRLLRHTGDARAIEAITELDFEVIWARSFRAVNAMTKRRTELLARLRPSAPHPKAAVIARLAAGFAAPRSVEALIAAVLEEPARLEARDVLRDALLEAGDARGEHMALDAIARTRPLTELELARRIELHRNGAAWYAPLAGLVMLPVLRDGFLASCHLAAERAHLVEATIGDPTWATVERIDLFYWRLPLPMRLFDHPVMRSLSTLSALQYEVAPAVWKPSVTWFRTVGIFHFQQEWRTLFDRGDLPPNLVRLETASAYATSADYLWVWQTRLFAQLRELAMSSGRGSVGSVYDRCTTASFDHLTRIDIGRYRFARDAAGKLSRMVVELPPSPREQPHTATIAAALAELPAGAIRDVRFDGRALDRKQRTAFERALAKQPLETFSATDR